MLFNIFWRVIKYYVYNDSHPHVIITDQTKIFICKVKVLAQDMSVSLGSFLMLWPTTALSQVSDLLVVSLNLSKTHKFCSKCQLLPHAWSSDIFIKYLKVQKNTNFNYFFLSKALITNFYIIQSHLTLNRPSPLTIFNISVTNLESTLNVSLNPT